MFNLFLEDNVSQYVVSGTIVSLKYTSARRKPEIQPEIENSTRNSKFNQKFNQKIANFRISGWIFHAVPQCRDRTHQPKLEIIAVGH